MQNSVGRPRSARARAFIPMSSMQRICCLKGLSRLSRLSCMCSMCAKHRAKKQEDVLREWGEYNVERSLAACARSGGDRLRDGAGVDRRTYRLARDMAAINLMTRDQQVQRHRHLIEELPQHTVGPAPKMPLIDSTRRLPRLTTGVFRFVPVVKRFRG